MTPEDAIKLIESISTIARMDGIITEDEQNIISQVKTDADKYVRLFEEIMDRGIISEDDIQSLERAKIRILKNATNVAGRDNLITDDERQILLKILEVINTSDFT